MLLLAGIGIDLSSLRFVMLGGGTFLLCALRLLFGAEAFSLGAGGLLLGREPGLLGTSTTGGRLVSVRGSSSATLIELLSASPPRRHRGASHDQDHNDDHDDDESAGYEEWHSVPFGIAAGQADGATRGGKLNVIAVRVPGSHGSTLSSAASASMSLSPIPTP